MKKLTFVSLLAVVVILATFFLSANLIFADKGDNGFNEFGYNYKARIFNGTGESWSLAKGLPADYLGIYAKDKLIMKWNAEWDRGNAEGWSNPPYKAWENNEWNGMVPGGSGEVWHYKIVWVGNYGADPTLIPEGAYGIWGQFAVIMDQGTVDAEHFWYTHAIPTGYGAYFN